MFDIAIIGGGPGGYVAAIRAAQMGARVAIFEKVQYGGTCLNRGCIPMKSLLYSSRKYADFIKFAELHNITVDKPEMDRYADEIKNGVVQKLTRGVLSLLMANGVTCIHQKAEILDVGKISTEDGKIFSAKNIIIATGTEPKALPFEVHNASHLWNSDAIFEKFTIPKRLIIIGGGVIGVEVAQCFSNFGTDVEIIEYQDQILPMFDVHVSETIAQSLIENKVKIHCSCSVSRVDERTVYFDQNTQTKKLSADYIFVATGRTPSFNQITLDALGIKSNHGFIETNNYMQTNVNGVYAIGDINGKSMLAHTAFAEGIVAVEHIMGCESSMSYGAVPQCVYTDLAVGCLGETEQTLQKLGKQYKKSLFPLSANGKASVEECTQGFIEMLSDPVYGEILGVSIVSPKATELINTCLIAMEQEITAEELADCIFAHPTLSEIIGEAAKGLTSGYIHYMNS